MGAAVACAVAQRRSATVYRAGSGASGNPGGPALRAEGVWTESWGRFARGVAYDPHMKTAAAAVLLLGLLILAASASADPRFHGGRVYVRGPGCNSETYRASSIIFFCGDAGVYVTNIRYSSYGGRTAVGTAVMHANNCIPFCGQGTFSSARVTIKLAAVVRCEGTLFYSRAYTHYIGPPPSGEPRSSVANIKPFGETECSSVLG